MKKKLFIIPMLALSLVSLAGCNNKGVSSNGDTNETVETMSAMDYKMNEKSQFRVRFTNDTEFVDITEDVIDYDSAEIIVKEAALNKIFNLTKFNPNDDTIAKFEGFESDSGYAKETGNLIGLKSDKHTMILRENSEFCMIDDYPSKLYEPLTLAKDGSPEYPFSTFVFKLGYDSYNTDIANNIVNIVISGPIEESTASSTDPAAETSQDNAIEATTENSTEDELVFETVDETITGQNETDITSEETAAIIEETSMAIEESTANAEPEASSESSIADIDN